MEAIIIVGLLAIVALNILASIRVVRDEFCTGGQKIVQALIVWLLPVVGALLIFGTKRDRFERSQPGPETLHDPDPFVSSPNLRSATGQRSLFEGSTGPAEGGPD